MIEASATVPSGTVSSVSFYDGGTLLGTLVLLWLGGWVIKENESGLVIKKFGASLPPGRQIALKGEAARGEKVFFSEGSAQCFQCHRVRDRGRDFGPDLSRSGQKC